MTPRTQRACTLALISLTAPLSLCAAAPAPEGTETTVTFGASRWSAFSTGEGGAQRYLYTGVEMGLAVGVRHRFEGGLTLAGEANAAPGVIQSRDNGALGVYRAPRYEPSDRALHGALSARVGWHGDYFGVEAGGTTLDVAGPETVPFLEERERIIVPAGQVWAGKHDLAYAWGRYAVGPLGGMNETLAMAGLGHASDALHIEAGAARKTGALAFAVKTRPGMRLGLDTAMAWANADGEDRDWRALLRIVIAHKQLGEGIY